MKAEKVCPASILLLYQGKEAVRKEPGFRPGGEAIICFNGFVFWLLRLPVLVLSEPGDEISEKLSGIFQDNWERHQGLDGGGEGVGHSISQVPTAYRIDPGPLTDHKEG